MADTQTDRRRQVVPKWDAFTMRASVAETGSLCAPNPVINDNQSIDAAIADFKMFPSFSVAADLLSVAVVENRTDVAHEAARFILENAPDANLAAVRLSQQLLLQASSEYQQIEVSTEFNIDSIYRQIHKLRAQLRFYPLSALHWCDLSRLYTSIGLSTQAHRTMRVAVGLAPQFRLVLRAAARLYVHQGDIERAHHLLLKSSQLTKDPWILSAEIAVASALNKSSQHIKSSIRWLDQSRWNPVHVSELSSAIGTIKHESGNRRAGNQLISSSLRHASENAIAQAAWVQRTFGGPNIPIEVLGASSEALAWQGTRGGEWNIAINKTHSWLIEQPFSSRPALLGSYLASRTLVDYEKSIQFAKHGLRANPDDCMLKNNLAFSLAQNSQVQEADKVMSSISTSDVNESFRMTYLATSGLIQYRLGNIERGNELYREAISLAKGKNDENAIVAQIYHAFEELRANTMRAATMRKDVLERANAMTKPADLLLVERLANYTSPTG